MTRIDFWNCGGPRALNEECIYRIRNPFHQHIQNRFRSFTLRHNLVIKEGVVIEARAGRDGFRRAKAAAFSAPCSRHPK